MLTIIALVEQNNPREISLKFQTREERNSLLDKLRSDSFILSSCYIKSSHFFRALVTATNIGVVNPLRRGSGTLRHGSHNKEKLGPTPAEGKFSARASRRLSKRELVLEENLSGGHSNLPSHQEVRFSTFSGLTQFHFLQNIADVEKETIHQIRDLSQQNEKLKYQVSFQMDDVHRPTNFCY